MVKHEIYNLNDPDPRELQFAWRALGMLAEKLKERKDNRLTIASLEPDALLGGQVRSGSQNQCNAERHRKAEARKRAVRKKVDEVLSRFESEAVAKGKSLHGLKSRAFEIASKEINAERRKDGRPPLEAESCDSVKKIYYERS